MFDLTEYLVACITRDSSVSDHLHESDLDNIISYHQNIQHLTEVKEFNDLIFYQQFVSKFDIFSYKYPEELEGVFDFDIFFQLLCSSNSCEISLGWTDTELVPDLIISVENPKNGDMVSKTVFELWSFQVQRNFEIFLNEQFRFAVLMFDNPDHKEQIMADQNKSLIKHKKRLQEYKAELALRKLIYGNKA